MKRLLSFSAFLFYAICSLAQSPSELCLKWAWLGAGPVSGESFEMNFPGNDSFRLEGNLEVIQTNLRGRPRGLMKYEISGSAWIPVQSMRFTFNDFGYLEHLEIWEWAGSAWEPQARIARSFDAMGQEQTFVFEMFENAGWTVLEAWEKGATIAAAMHP